MADIRFYDFEFNLLRVLPPYADGIGYKAIDTKRGLYDSGSLEINFSDSILKKIIKENEADIIVRWRDFVGVLNSYRWTDKEDIVTGTHLNGFLERNIVRATKYFKNDEYEDVTNSVEALVNDAINKSTAKSWLIFNRPDDTKTITYGTEEPKTLAEWFSGLYEISGYGYEIKADFTNKKFYLELIKPNINPLMLSEDNLNAHEFETTYINKNMAFGGYYKSEDGWIYIAADNEKTGVFQKSTVLKSEKESDAFNELKKCKAEFEIAASARNIEYGKHYKIGDVLRVQKDGATDKRLVSGVNRWEENGYYENPTMIAYDEEDI